jgi:uncharacterized membrane protein HdeD (DUF308 family)
VKDLLYAVVGLIAAIVAAYGIYSYLTQVRPRGTDPDHTWMIVGVISAIVALICGGLFLSNRVNREEQIHITE